MQNQKESTFLDQDHKLFYRDFLHRNATEDVFETRISLLQSVAGYLPDLRDVNEISSAFDRAYYYHKKVHQFRGTVSAIDGRNQQINQFQEYMVHPGAVAQILAEWKCDKNIIIGGLLHDTVEDTNLRDNPEIIKEWFGANGEKIFNLVMDTTKVTSLTPVTDLTPREIKERNLAKLLTAFYENPGAILIKLADRLHNMRTIHGLSEDKQKEFARETIEIFIPIARIVGMHEVADEMTELAYRRLWPDQVEEVEAKIEERYKPEHLDPLLDPINKFKEVHIDVQRPKFFNFINPVNGEIVDPNLFPLRIICKNISEFYEVVSYFQARMTTVNLEELRKDGRLDFDFGFGDMNLAVSIFEWDGYLKTDSSLISLHQLKPFDKDEGDIFTFNKDERVELLYLRKEYAYTKLFKPQQRLRQYYEREKVLKERLGLVSSAQALRSIQIPMIFVVYVEGEKVKPYVLSAGDTAWELAF